MFEEEQDQGRQLSISDYLRIAYRGRWIIIISFLVVFAASAYLTFTSPSIYQAGTTVLIESKGTMERSIFGPDYFGSQTTLITNQIEILKSRKLAERSANRLLTSEVRDSISILQPDDEGIVPTLRGIVGWLRANLEVEHRKDTDVLEIKFSAFTPFECAYITNVIAEEFKILNAETSQSEVADLRDFLDEQVTKKEVELRKAEEKLRSYQEEEKVASLDDETAKLVERVAQAESMLEQARIDLNGAQEKKASLTSQLDERKSSLGTDLGETSTPLILALQEQYSKLIADKARYSVLIESEIQNPSKISFERQLKSYDDKIEGLRKKLEEETQKMEASGMVKDEFQMSQQLITSLMTTETDIKSLTAKIIALEEVVGAYDVKLNRLPLKTLELARLARKQKVQEETFLMMTTKLEETKITQAGQSGNVRILDEAIEPYSPIKPNKKLNILLGALIGLGLGIGLVFVIEYFDNTVKTIEEVEGLGLNLLGAIPKIELDKLDKKLEKKKKSSDLNEGSSIESRLVTHFEPKSPISEAYRTLRTNLQFTRLGDQSLKTLLVTSAGPKEGKSTTVANLAITIAQQGAKVVLVDSDLRRPVIHSIFGLDKDTGLTNYMVDSVPYDKIVKNSVVENLSVVTCGVLPPNPSEMLGSSKMDAFIAKLKENFDVVLFDSPPVIAVTDAAILCGKVDSTFLVISSGQTNRDAIGRAKILLENVNAKVAGALLNNVDVEASYGSSYNYYYYHYYHGTHGKDGKKLKRKQKAEA